ncbi:Tat pathway signal sequence [Apiospora arundinis]|uniref:Tat pathway signal sequence n=1 Tax=Apiospora arundinis TaxID=335852 RepID=A0ABR2I7G3_9PEZI
MTELVQSHLLENRMRNAAFSVYKPVPGSPTDDDVEYSTKDGSRAPAISASRLGHIMGAKHTTLALVLSHIVVLFCVYLPTGYLILKKWTTTDSCAKLLSTWSPALEAVSYLPPEHFDAEIDQTNKYRGLPLEAPTPEINAAWQEIGLGAPGIRLTEDDLKTLNKTDTPGRRLHRIPDEYGGGYLGLLEVFHMLHCLDALREATFYNWPYYEQNVSRKAVIIHHDHCIDALRMSIMCTSDVTPITFYDSEALPGRQYPLPDFSSLHTCRNFDAILEWNKNNPRAVMWEEVGNASTFRPGGA